jgi:type VI protein secretion system component VasF
MTVTEGIAAAKGSPRPVYPASRLKGAPKDGPYRPNTAMRTRKRSLRHQEWRMPVWFWIAIGVALWLVMSVMLAFVFARVLSTIGREISEMH